MPCGTFAWVWPNGRWLELSKEFEHLEHDTQVDHLRNVNRGLSREHRIRLPKAVVEEAPEQQPRRAERVLMKYESLHDEKDWCHPENPAIWEGEDV